MSKTQTPTHTDEPAVIHAEIQPLPEPVETPVTAGMVGIRATVNAETSAMVDDLCARTNLDKGVIVDAAIRVALSSDKSQFLVVLREIMLERIEASLKTL